MSILVKNMNKKMKHNSLLIALGAIAAVVFLSACHDQTNDQGAKAPNTQQLVECSQLGYTANPAGFGLNNSEADDEADQDSEEDSDKKQTTKKKASTKKHVNTEDDDSDLEKISYDNYMKSLIEKRCLECHAAEQSYPDLSTWKAVNKVKALVTEVIIQETMPPKEYPQRLDVEMIRRAKSWEKRGFPKANTPPKTAKSDKKNIARDGVGSKSGISADGRQCVGSKP